MEWMILPLRRYAETSGRSRRKEYWMFMLFNFLMQIALNIIDSVLGLGGHTSSYSTNASGAFAAGAASSGGVLSGLYSLAVLVPTIAVSIRRLHDVNHTAWWLAAPFILALVLLAVMTIGRPAGSGAIIMGVAGLAFGGLALLLFVWSCSDGTRGTNRFGPDPKAGYGNLEETFR